MKKFLKVKKKLKVKKLKGKNISIAENLTGYRMNTLNEAREKFGFRNVWTYDGRILYKDSNNGKSENLTENLTGYRMSTLNEAREKFGIRNVWKYDGRILYKDNNDEQEIKIYYE